MALRLKSLEPFTRHLTGQNFLNMLEINSDKDIQSRLLIIKTKYLCYLFIFLTK